MDEKERFIVMKLSKVKEVAEAAELSCRCPKEYKDTDDKPCAKYFLEGGCYQCWFDYLIDIGTDESM